MNTRMNNIEEYIALSSSIDGSQNWQIQDISSFSLMHTFINSRECPHCGSHHVVSKGNYRGRKRYQCKDCGVSYNDLTKTPFSGIHNLDKIKKYLNSMIRGDSIRKAAEIVNVSITTSFYWRHKLLNGLSRLPSPKMKNVKEIKELEIPYSHKGQRSKLPSEVMRSKISAVFVCDRTGKLDSDSITFSERCNNPIFRRLREITNQHTDIICPPIFENIMGNLDGNIKTTNTSYTQPLLINHIINSWQTWMKRFHGVASKYLANYLHWFDYLDNTQLNQHKSLTFVQLLLMKELNPYTSFQVHAFGNN